MKDCLPRLLICDLDGTLVDSVSGIVRTTRAVLLAAGEPVPEPEMVKPLIGLPLVDVFTVLLPEPPAAEYVERLIQTYRDIYARLIIPATRPFPGVVETLAEYQRRGGLIAVATSKIERVARAAVESAGLASLVSLVVGHDSVTNPKPAPDMVLRCLAEANVSPGEALVVGDTTFDVTMARGAGVESCAVTYGVHSRRELELAKADRVVDCFSDVLTSPRVVRR